MQWRCFVINSWFVGFHENTFRLKKKTLGRWKCWSKNLQCHDLYYNLHNTNDVANELQVEAQNEVFQTFNERQLAVNP